MDGRTSRYGNRVYLLLPPILLNPVPCGKATGRRMQFGRSTSSRLLPARPKGTLAKARTGRKNADGLLGDAHDAAHGLLETLRGTSVSFVAERSSIPIS